MTPPPQGFTLACPLRCLGTARSSFICNRYKTDRAYFAAGDTSVGFTPDSRVLAVSFHDPTLVRLEHAAKRHLVQI